MAAKKKTKATRAPAAPQITAAAIKLVTDVDRIKTRITKLAKRLDITVPNVAADTAPGSSLTGAIAGASAAVAAVHALMEHVEQNV